MSLEHYEHKETLTIQQEAEALSAEVLETQKNHEVFANYCEEIFALEGESEKAKNIQRIIDMFGGKDLKEAIANFCKEKDNAIRASEKTTKEHPAGDQGPLNNLNLTMLFLGTPQINTLLTTYYEDLHNKDLTNDQFQIRCDNGRNNIQSYQTPITNINPTTNNQNTYTQYKEEQENLSKPNASKIPRNFSSLSSTGATRSKRGTTECAKTARLTAAKEFHINLNMGNAFDAMYKGPEDKSHFKEAYRSENYQSYTQKHNYFQEYEKQITDDMKSCKPKSQEDFKNIESLASGANFGEIFLESTRYKQYGHRALIFKSGTERYVLDPYMGPRNNRNDAPQPYADYINQVTNKRNIMRINFYDAPVQVNPES